VTYDGKPLVSGSVMMVADDGLPLVGVINPDGSYTVSGVPVGKVRVAVNSPPPEPPVNAGGPAGPLGKNPASAPPPLVDDAGWFPIPEKYGDPEQSGLTFHVKRGPNIYNIDLP
jgi:hypothetical protein